MGYFLVVLVSKPVILEFITTLNMGAIVHKVHVSNSSTAQQDFVKEKLEGKLYQKYVCPMF